MIRQFHFDCFDKCKMLRAADGSDSPLHCVDQLISCLQTTVVHDSVCCGGNVC
jgi:hypothetical protein